MAFGTQAFCFVYRNINLFRFRGYIVYDEIDFIQVIVTGKRLLACNNWSDDLHKQKILKRAGKVNKLMVFEPYLIIFLYIVYLN